MIGNISIPPLFVFLPGKFEEIYSRFFYIVKNLCPTLDPESLMIDFEREIIIGFSKMYPNTTITINLHTF